MGDGKSLACSSARKLAPVSTRREVRESRLLPTRHQRQQGTDSRKYALTVVGCRLVGCPTGFEAGEGSVLFIVLNSVTSTPQCIRQPEPRDVHDVCVFVCKCVLGSPRASQPLNIFAYAFSSTSAFSRRLTPFRPPIGAASAF